MAERTKATRPDTNTGEYTVSELSGAIKRALEDGFGYVRLRGEISGYRGPHASGHCYFALKDEKAKIDAIIWKGTFSKLQFRPEEGMEVIAQGRVTSYPNGSKYQIVIDTLEPAGVGALMAMLEERKKKFAAEGLFDEERKKRLPFLPRAIGIVTSPTGAVIRDMLHGFEERFPAHVIVWPVRVQGETCADEVAAAVRGFNAIEPGGRIPRPDVLIVARGGGSLEDLWGFNEEAVVRAVAASDIPVISAVGHETDWTLIDLVADARAPTPTKAAEWAVPKYSDLIEELHKFDLRLRTGIRRSLDNLRTGLKAAERGLPRPQDLTASKRQSFDSIEQNLSKALIANTRTHTMRYREQALRLTPRVLTQRLLDRSQRVDNLMQKCTQALYRTTAARRTRFERTGVRINLETIRSNMRRGQDLLAVSTRQLRTAVSVLTDRKKRQLDANTKLLATLSYRSILNRGYAVIRDQQGLMVRRADQTYTGQALTVEFGDAAINATVNSSPPASQSIASASEPDAKLAQPKRPRKVNARRKLKSDQGSLF